MMECSKMEYYEMQQVKLSLQVGKEDERKDMSIDMVHLEKLCLSFMEVEMDSSGRVMDESMQRMQRITNTPPSSAGKSSLLMKLLRSGSLYEPY
ncbi:hypothetical protein LOAG_13031 [Loa loa]|uniref:ABC transporter domain-containing protein n=1 Tax=Loa loa TaxID=7209 RepID=A0A1I7VTA2_LOALO|nr:hypothetical protein LOAG_13031 [Loa loa]EFO15478.2 hypothetical protein LOAG_13031 [Loa loa]